VYIMEASEKGAMVTIWLTFKVTIAYGNISPIRHRDTLISLQLTMRRTIIKTHDKRLAIPYSVGRLRRRINPQVLRGSFGSGCGGHSSSIWRQKRRTLHLSDY